MDSEKITIDPTLLVYIAQTIRRVPETLYDFQKIKNLACGGRPVYGQHIDLYRDSIPGRLELVKGDFSVIGRMPRLKKLSISAMEVSDFSFLENCTALESLEIAACGAIDCAYLDNMKNLKSLSLHNCPELKHMEHILNLPSLVRLSLKDSEIWDAARLVDCGIPEVHLPERVLKEKREEKPDAGHGTGVPFHMTVRVQGQYPYMLQELNSQVWAFYTGAYGDVWDYINILMGERDVAPEQKKLRRLENIPKTNYEIAFDNLCENLWHQMSFYPATWLVLPYLAKLMEGWEKAGDLEWMFKGILAAGNFLATDVWGDRPDEESIAESYHNAMMQIRVMTIDFLALHMDYVRREELQWERELAVAATAILGERELAYMLILSGFDSCYVVCSGCEYCDEEMEFGYFDLAGRIEAAEIPDGQWDGENLEDVRVWLFNLLGLMGDAEGAEMLRYFLGTYTCPQCGRRTAVLAGMRAYYLSE